MLTYRFELLLDGAWVDITQWVRHSKPVTSRRGRADEAPKPQPASDKLRLNNHDDRFNPRNPTGPYYGHLKRNTPLRISALIPTVEPISYTEVYSFEPRWNEDRSDCWVDIDAAGVLRRATRDDGDVVSHYRSWMRRHNGFPVVRYYWALEDGPDSTEAVPDIGDAPGVLVALSGSPSKKAWSGAQMTEWFPNGALLQQYEAFRFPCDMRGSTASAWEVTALLDLPDDDSVCQWEVYCGSQLWVLQFYASTFNQVYVIRPDGTLAIVGYSPGVLTELGPLWVSLRVTNVGGTQAQFRWEPVMRDSNPTHSTIVWTDTAPMQYPREFVVWNASIEKANVGVSNVSVSEATSASFLTYSEMKGGLEDFPTERFETLSTDRGIDTTFTIIDPIESQMGRQYIESYEDLITECAASIDGYLFESRTDGRLGMHHRRYHTRVPLTIDYAELVDQIEPAEDDQRTVNVLTVDNKGGSTKVLRRDTGPLSTSEIGEFPGKIGVNVLRSAFAEAIGQRALAEGTLDTARFPSLTVSAAYRPDQYEKYLAADVGSVLRLTGFAPAGYYDDLYVFVVGTERVFDQTDHRVTFHVVPADIGWYAWKVGTSRADLDTTLVGAHGPATPTLAVTSPRARVTTDPTMCPFDVMIAGERITVTAVTGAGAAQTLTVVRSVNGVVKTLPANASVHMYPPAYVQVWS